MGFRCVRRLCIFTVIAEYSIRIEDRNFAPLFKKLEPTAEWGKSALIAWGVIDGWRLVLSESDAHTIVRAWLNSNVRKWNKECDAESRGKTRRATTGTLSARSPRRKVRPENSPNLLAVQKVGTSAF